MLNKMAEAVRELGDLLIEWHQDENILSGEWDGPQLKTKADIMAHKMLTEKLAELDPKIPIISEEDAGSLKIERPDKYWIIDPIDGTRSYVEGYPGYVTQIAYIENGKPLLAAVFNPVNKLLYSAERKKGAFLNGERLKIQEGNRREILIDNYPEPVGSAKDLYSMLGFSKYVESGSISLKICKIADGCADVFFKDVPVRDWDLAAPQLILEESGGYMFDASGNRFTYSGSYEHNGLIAANSKDTCEKILEWHLSKKQGDRK